MIRAAALCLALALPAAAQGIETPLTDQPGDPARGRAIVADRGLSACLLCHSAPLPGAHLQGAIGPGLAGVGERLTPAEIRHRLVDARQANPETVMPPYFVAEGLTRIGAPWRGRPALSAQQIEDVVAWLATLRTP